MSAFTNHVYGITRQVSLKILDEKGLASFLSTILDRERHPQLDEAHAKTAELVSRYVGAIETSISEDMLLTFKISGRYHGDDWNADFAPYVEGFIEWKDEDGNVWRDVFDDGMVITEEPNLIWDKSGMSEEQMNDAINAAKSEASEYKAQAEELTRQVEEKTAAVNDAETKVAELTEALEKANSEWLDEDAGDDLNSERVSNTRLSAICEMGMRYQALSDEKRLANTGDFDPVFEITETVSDTYAKYADSGQLKASAAAFLDKALEKNGMLLEKSENWYEESWATADLYDVLEKNGVEPSKENIEKLEEECLKHFENKEKERCDEIVSIVNRLFKAEEAPKSKFL